jgi:RNA polymerase sigma-70 factor (ECF subfamily)
VEAAEGSDLDLLEAWRRGDRDAGGHLIERHFASLYRFFRNKTRDDVEDLIQKTLLACVEHKDRFRGDSSFRTFLFVVARNTLLDRLRANGSAPVFDTGLSSVHDLAASPTTRIGRAREHQALARALGRIPIDLQIALELFYWEQMSTEEIAAVLGVPQGTAKSRLRRAREALLEAMSHVEETPGRAAAMEDLDAWAAGVREELGLEVSERTH